MVHFLFVEESDSYPAREEEKISHVPISPHLTALPSHFPSRRMPLGCLIVSLVPHRMRRDIPALFVDRRRKRRPSYVHMLELPREQTMPASFPPPGLPAPGLATGPLFDFLALQSSCVCTILEANGMTGSNKARYSTPLVQGRT